MMVDGARLFWQVFGVSWEGLLGGETRHLLAIFVAFLYSLQSGTLRNLFGQKKCGQCSAQRVRLTQPLTTFLPQSTHFRQTFYQKKNCNSSLHETINTKLNICP